VRIIEGQNIYRSIMAFLGRITQTTGAANVSSVMFVLDLSGFPHLIRLIKRSTFAVLSVTIRGNLKHIREKEILTGVEVTVDTVRVGGQPEKRL
jgi:hypothetical protein